MTRAGDEGMDPTMQAVRSPGLGTLWACALGAVALGACSEMAPPQPPVSALPPHLVVRIDPASSADCPSGGSVVLSGNDGNGDGVLQDAEVSSRAVVCHPSPAGPPPPILLRFAAEPPGARCAAGGTAIASGPDLDRDGLLDDGEVAHVDYACGEVLLTRLVAEPAGPRCAAAGVEFQFGRDRDGDGALEDAEVEATELSCGDVLAHDVEIRSEADMTALASVRVISGGVLVSASMLQALSLPRLEHVTGSLEILGFQVRDVALPALQDIGGALTLLDGVRFDCPQLRRVGGLALRGVGLSDLSGFPALSEVDGDLVVTDVTAPSLELPALSIRGQLEIIRNPRLTRVVAKLADRVGSVAIFANPALQSLDLSVTPREAATAQVGSVQLFDNPGLAHVALRAGEVQSLGLSTSAGISDIALDVAKFDFDVSLFDITTPFSLTLSSPSPDGVELGGGLFISSSLQTFQATVPVTVHGLCVFDKTLLQALDLSAPLRVGEGVRFSDNARLVRISSIALTGSLQVINNARLGSLSFVTPATPGEIGTIVITDNPVLGGAPSLASLAAVRGFVDVERNPALTSLFGPSLTLVDGGMTVTDNASLAELQLPELRKAGAALFVQRNAALRFLEMPALTEVTDQLFIAANPQLQHIGFDALAHAEFFFVDDNPRLPACQVLAVFAHVTSRVAAQSGNDSTATCP